MIHSWKRTSLWLRDNAAYRQCCCLEKIISPEQIGRKAARWNARRSKRQREGKVCRAISSRVRLRRCASLSLSLFLFLARTRALSFPFSLPLSLQYSHSYYFSSVLVTIGICQRRKRALKEGKINRESGCEAETASRKREVQEKREKENGQDDTGGRVCRGGSWSRSCFISGWVRRSRGGKTG